MGIRNSYVFNNPMNWVDPSGFEADSGGSEGAASYSYPTGCTDCSGASSDSSYNPLGTADANGYLTTTPDTGGIDAFPSVG